MAAGYETHQLYQLGKVQEFNIQYSSVCVHDLFTHLLTLLKKIYRYVGHYPAPF